MESETSCVCLPTGAYISSRVGHSTEGGVVHSGTRCSHSQGATLKLRAFQAEACGNVGLMSRVDEPIWTSRFRTLEYVHAHALQLRQLRCGPN